MPCSKEASTCLIMLHYYIKCCIIVQKFIQIELISPMIFTVRLLYFLDISLATCEGVAFEKSRSHDTNTDLLVSEVVLFP